MFSRLNTQPMHTPVNASPIPSRTSAHDSGTVWFARPSLAETCTLYSLPVSRRTHCQLSGPRAPFSGPARLERDGHGTRGTQAGRYSRRRCCGLQPAHGCRQEGTLARLKAIRRELADPKIKEHRGRIVKTTGDGLLVEFPSVVDAVRCAVE